MRTRWLSFTVLAAAATLFGCGAPTDPVAGQDGQDPTSEPALVHAEPARVETLQPTFETVGTLVPVPEHVVILSSQVSGQIENLEITEGQHVQAGGGVIQLDARMAEAERDKARAALDEARANAALLERGSLPQEIEAARGDARNADATTRAAKDKLEALQPLFDKGEISDVQFGQAKSNLDAAEALSAAAAAKRKLLESGTRQESLAEARAKVASAEAELQAKELVVELSTIASPIDGTVTELTARKGMYMQPGTTLATIVDLSSLFVQFRVPLDFLNGLENGAIVTVTALSGSGDTHTGTVERIGKQADASTGDVMGYARIENPDGSLTPNTGCRVRVALPTIPNALVVPASSVADRDGTPVVTVIRDDKAYETEVVTGVRTSEYAQILDGIAPGDVVATSGGYGLPDECPVRIAPATSEAGNPAS